MQNITFIHERVTQTLGQSLTLASNHQTTIKFTFYFFKYCNTK